MSTQPLSGKALGWLYRHDPEVRAARAALGCSVPCRSYGCEREDLTVDGYCPEHQPF